MLARLMTVSPALLSCALGAVIVNSTAPSTTPPAAPVPAALQPYTPTRLEWLALELNASFRLGDYARDGYRLDYVAIKPDRIVAQVQHLPSAAPEALAYVATAGANCAALVTSQHGWRDSIRISSTIRAANDE